MGASRRSKNKNELKIRPYDPCKQTQPAAEPKKANAPEPKKATSAPEAAPEVAEPVVPSTTSAPTTTATTTTQQEDIPAASDATPATTNTTTTTTIVIEDDDASDTAEVVDALADQESEHQEEQDDSNKNNDTEENKKNRGSWTSEKQVVLLQKYAEHFPPGAPWGKSTEAWQKIVDAVNAVAPNDTPLRYDACRRAVDRISEKYMEEESIQKAAIAALAKRNKHEGEKADKLIQQESKKERKRMKRLIIQRLASERPPIDIASRSFTPAALPPPPPPQPQYVAAPFPPPVFNYIQFDQAYVEEQRQYQRSVLQHLESMNEILKDLSQRLKKDE